MMMASNVSMDDLSPALFSNPLIVEKILSFFQKDLKVSSYLSLRLVTPALNNAVLNSTRCPSLQFCLNLTRLARSVDVRGKQLVEMLKSVDPRIVTRLNADLKNHNLKAFIRICKIHGPHIRNIHVDNVGGKNLSHIIQAIDRTCHDLAHLSLALSLASFGGNNKNPFTFGPHETLVSLEISGITFDSFQDYKSVIRGLIFGTPNLSKLKVWGALLMELPKTFQFWALTELIIIEPNGGIGHLLKTLSNSTNFPRLDSIHLPPLYLHSAEGFFEEINALTKSVPAVTELEFKAGFLKLQHFAWVSRLHSAFPNLKRLEMVYDLGYRRGPKANVSPVILAALSALSMWAGSLKELKINFIHHKLSLRHLEQILTAMGPSLFVSGLQKLKIYGSQDTGRSNGFSFKHPAYDRLFSILQSMRNVKEVLFMDVQMPGGGRQNDARLLDFFTQSELSNVVFNN